MLKLSLALLMIFSSLAHAEENQSTYLTEVMGACRAEAKTHCQVNKAEVASCLKEKSRDQKIKLTDGCRDTLAKKK